MDSSPAMRPTDEKDTTSREYAESLDAQDKLSHLRAEFIVPSKADLRRKTLAVSCGQIPPCQSTLAEDCSHIEDPCVYLCGNSLGLQPRRTRERIDSHLSAWASKGVMGHFATHDDSEQPPFIHVDDVAAEKMAPLVGASRDEVAAMETLTANLHFLMASFYRPTPEKYRIIIEGKAFPSDHYAVESQIRHHSFDPKDALILIEPSQKSSFTVTTSHILSVIDQHASTTALILLPGIQYFTGQYFDIQAITAHAHSKGIIIGWDLAHAVGNMDLRLHEWDVDFAVWCNYKYLNAGPGAVGGLFVHHRHGKVDMQAEEKGDEGFRPRLSGWWGGDKATRFSMGNRFVPIPGAAGFQVGNPSALALTALLASLEVFAETSMSALRAKSVALTGYLEELLDCSESSSKPYHIITPSDPKARGAQLSVQLEAGLLEGVMTELEKEGVVVDERKPDVIRMSPAPLYNTFVDVWEGAIIFREACRRVQERNDVTQNIGILHNGDKDEKR